jgi:hypothetical protein
VSDAKHTPGRLSLRGTTLYGRRLLGFARDERAVEHVARATTPGGTWKDETEANARRLAACWNACEGIPTELLETAVVAGLAPR